MITGGSSGIGLETGRLLATHGYPVTLVARNEGRLKKMVGTLKGCGHQILAADLTENGDLQRVIDHIATEKYNLMINNAGAGQYGTFMEIPLQEQLATMQLNMNALVKLSYAYLQHATSGDALVNIGSLLAHSSLPGGAVYAATKSFVANFSESLWHEFKRQNIFVLSFNPGASNSDFHANAGRKTSDFPDFVVADVKDVVSELVNAVEQRSKPRVVQGWKNRFMIFGFKLLDRKAAVNIVGRISPGMR